MPGIRLMTQTVGVLLSLVSVAAACSSDSSSSDVAVETPETTASTTESETEAAPAADVTSLLLDEPDWTDLDEWHTAALGGITFGVRPEYSVHHDNHMVTVRSRFEPDRGRSLPVMVVSLVHDVFGAPVDGVDGFVNVSGWGTAEANGQTLELFGMTLEGYSFTEEEGADDQPVYMFSAYGPGYQGGSAWQPFPRAELFLAEIPGAVLAVGYVGGDDAELAEACEVFETVAPTLQLDGPLPAEPTDLLSPIISDDIGSVPEPLVLEDTGPPVLTQAFAPVEPGTYRSAHLGTPTSFTTQPGWWVQLNFPGQVVLTGADSFGPSDRAVLIESAPTELIATTVGPVPVGEPIDFTDLATFAEAPPKNLLVTDYQVVEIGGLEAERLDIIIDPDASCEVGDPCQYAWRAVLPYPPHDLRVGYHNRIWRIGGLDQPVQILAQTPDPSWLDAADEFVSTIDFG